MSAVWELAICDIASMPKGGSRVYPARYCIPPAHAIPLSCLSQLSWLFPSLLIYLKSFLKRNAAVLELCTFLFPSFPTLLVCPLGCVPL